MCLFLLHTYIHTYLLLGIKLLELQKGTHFNFPFPEPERKFLPLHALLGLKKKLKILPVVLNLLITRFQFAMRIYTLTCLK